MYLQEEWGNEKKLALEALEKIANSENIDDLVKNLKKLQDVYASGIAIDNDNLSKLIGNLSFEMPKFKEYFDSQLMRSNESTEKNDKKYFICSSIIAVISLIIGIVFGHINF
jgi:hypothetical protein